jgi:hypothetical protein
MCCCVGLITVVMVCHRVAEGGGVGGGEVDGECHGADRLQSINEWQKKKMQMQKSNT